MLFADAVGFSKLSEAQIPAFVERFLGGVRHVMDRQKHAPLSFNTWGDGLYFTFDSVSHANDFALDLSEAHHRADKIGAIGSQIRQDLDSGGITFTSQNRKFCSGT